MSLFKVGPAGGALYKALGNDAGLLGSIGTGSSLGLTGAGGAFLTSGVFTAAAAGGALYKAFGAVGGLLGSTGTTGSGLTTGGIGSDKSFIPIISGFFGGSTGFFVVSTLGGSAGLRSGFGPEGATGDSGD